MGKQLSAEQTSSRVNGSVIALEARGKRFPQSPADENAPAEEDEVVASEVTKKFLAVLKSKQIPKASEVDQSDDGLTSAKPTSTTQLFQSVLRSRNPNLVMTFPGSAGQMSSRGEGWGVSTYRHPVSPTKASASGMDSRMDERIAAFIAYLVTPVMALTLLVVLCIPLKFALTGSKAQDMVWVMPLVFIFYAPFNFAFRQIVERLFPGPGKIESNRSNPLVDLFLACWNGISKWVNGG